jgi:peroxiredoxin Q/BCP
MSLEVGKKAPDFEARDQNNKTHKLNDLKGKTTLIYFYPKDETPGCTVQACSLRDNFDDLKNQGVDVIGVSKDDVASHIKFAQRHKLPFPILADPEHKMIEAYNAWGEKSLYGRKFFGTIRSGVLIGPDLKILAVWPKLSPLKTVPEVKKWLKANK